MERRDKKMYRAFNSLIFKLLLVFIAGWLAFGFMYINDLGWIVLLAFIVAIINYLIGDLILIRAAGNVTAAIVDGIIAGLTAYILDLLVVKFSTTLVTILIFSAIIVVAEYFFNQYLVKDHKIKE
jgi:hypothetical protein